MSAYFFYLFAAVLIFASLCVVLARNPLYNVLSLVVAIFSLSCLFVLLEAFFVGMILLLVYAGAVLVFFLFVVMCLNLNAVNLNPEKRSRFQWLGILVGILYLFSFFLAPYFLDCISEHDLDELNVEIIRSTLYKVNEGNEIHTKINFHIL